MGLGWLNITAETVLSRVRRLKESGVASAVKTHPMSVRVVVREGETIKSALDRLRRHVRRQIGRPAHKHRYGYYEKPSELRRKRAKKEALMRENPLFVYPQSALFARTGPSNSLKR